MKQVVQSYRSGNIRIVETPVPQTRPGCLQVRTVASLVSIGTEKYMLELAGKSLLGKALARPDLARQVIAKVQADGILEAWRQAMGRLDSPVPLGYSLAGVIVDVGHGLDSFTVGGRVACGGHPYASHAEVVSVPRNLCAEMPDNVDFESAAFAMLGAIALHAVRTAEVALGEKIAVIGLGLLGQIAAQLLNAAGCHVFGTDIDPRKAEMALQHGAEATAVGRQATADAVRQWTGGLGADAVIIFASTSKNDPIEVAAETARERARIVVPGLVGLNIPRKVFYEKELQLVVSRSAGPGIYDPDYEAKGVDYPVPYVRWTWQRNMAEFLALLSQGKVQVGHLITHRFPIERATEAYKLIMEGREPYIGVLINYPSVVHGPQSATLLTRKVDMKPTATQRSRQPRVSSRPTVTIGLIGAGLFANTTLLPALKKVPGVNLRGVATATGLSGHHTGTKFGFEYATTDYHGLLNDPEIDCILIATRHHLHACLVMEALQADKHVFVEKPLALNEEELREIVRAYREANQRIDESTNAQTRNSKSEIRKLMVGFNRRFSPFSVATKDFFAGWQEPLVINCRVNAGFIPGDSWVHDPLEGGGRIIGEVCHFVDLIQYLAGVNPVRVYAETPSTSGAYRASDNVVISLKLADGAVATITYTAAGDKGFPRERIEVFGGGTVAVIDNFKSATFVRAGKTRRMRKWWSVDRGHQTEMEAFVSAIRNGREMPVPFEDYVSTTLTTFMIEESLVKGMPIPVSLGILDLLEDAS